jgi:hypothetical protein
VAAAVATAVTAAGVVVVAVAAVAVAVRLLPMPLPLETTAAGKLIMMLSAVIELVFHCHTGRPCFSSQSYFQIPS